MHTANGRIVASVPKPAFMDVYPSMASAVNGTIPNNMFSKVNPLDAYLKPLPATTAPRVMTALDKMIAMGSQTDGHPLQAAAETHHKAVSSVDATSATSTAPPSHLNSPSRVGPKSDSQHYGRAKYRRPAFSFFHQSADRSEGCHWRQYSDGSQASGLGEDTGQAATETTATVVQHFYAAS